MWRKLSHSIPGAQNAQTPPQISTLKSEQPESPQSHPGLHAPSPGSPGPQHRNTRSSLQTVHVAECLCCGGLPSGGRGLNNLPPLQKVFPSRGGFNKAERKLKSKIIGYRAKLILSTPEQQAKNLVLVLTDNCQPALSGSWHQVPPPFLKTF